MIIIPYTSLDIDREAEVSFHYDLPKYLAKEDQQEFPRALWLVQYHLERNKVTSSIFEAEPISLSGRYTKVRLRLCLRA